jgi:hypothetical protein
MVATCEQTTKFALILLSLLAFRTDAFSARLIGTGAHNCREYLDAVRNDPETDRAMTQWALGYISGTVLSMEKQTRDVEKLPSDLLQ